MAVLAGTGVFPDGMSIPKWRKATVGMAVGAAQRKSPKHDNTRWASSIGHIGGRGVGVESNIDESTDAWIISIMGEDDINAKNVSPIYNIR